MSEDDLAKKIKNHLEEDVPLDVFAKLWFRGKKFNDNQMTSKLLKFSENHKLDYLIVLGKPRRVRFWKLKDISLLSKGENNG